MVVLCALYLHRDRVLDCKFYADLLPIYSSCAPDTQFVRIFIFNVENKVKIFEPLSRRCGNLVFDLTILFFLFRFSFDIRLGSMLKVNTVVHTFGVLCIRTIWGLHGGSCLSVALVFICKT